VDTKTANWIAGVVLPLLLTTGCVVDSMGAARAHALLDRPVELWRDLGGRVERATPDGRSGKGAPFGGYQINYQVNGQDVRCIGRFGHYHCEGGWRIKPQLARS
jgi:hypothetical protein